MSFDNMRKISSAVNLPDAKRAVELRSEIVSLLQQVTPAKPDSLDLRLKDLLTLVEFCSSSSSAIPTEHGGGLLTEVLALLRNVIPFNERLRNDLATCNVNETLTALVFEKPLTNNSSSDHITCYSRLLQYVANFVAVVPESSKAFFDSLLSCEQRPLLHVMKSQHEKPASLAVVVLCRLLQDDSNWFRFLEDEEAFVDITNVLVQKTVKTSNLDAMQLLKRIVESSHLFTKYFGNFDLSSRCFLLDLISEQLSGTQQGSTVLTLPQDSLEFCINTVKKHIEKLRKQNYEDERDATEILFVKFITILALSSLNKKSVVTTDLELLIMCIECLRTVHNLGKQSTRGLDQRIDFDALAGNEEEIFEHPLFGLKKDLVRLIGNMCYNNKLNQETVRDFDGIELLCDMSSLDARNPYITQWVILALKNLTHGNEENQKIIASLTRKTET